jgi:hypothetical protein
LHLVFNRQGYASGFAIFGSCPRRCAGGFFVFSLPRPRFRKPFSGNTSRFPVPGDIDAAGCGGPALTGRSRVSPPPRGNPARYLPPRYSTYR